MLDDAALELPQSRLRERAFQLGLAHQKDLEQLFLCSFQVAQKPNQFQAGRREVLRVVDHEQAGHTIAVALQQELV